MYIPTPVCLAMFLAFAWLFASSNRYLGADNSKRSFVTVESRSEVDGKSFSNFVEIYWNAINNSSGAPETLKIDMGV
jgi:hypothetical protein